MKLADLFPIIVDESMPPDELKFVQNGKVIRTVVNIGTEKQEKDDGKSIR